jgi:hypothetical protein
MPDEDLSAARGCLIAALIVLPVWTLLAVAVYWLGHR